MNFNIIKTEIEYAKAIARLDFLNNKIDDHKLNDEYEMLVMLITRYEESKFKIKEADPIQIIKMKMDYMGLKQKDLIPYLGSKATTSKIMTYKMALTLKHIWSVSEKLKLPIGLLAQPYELKIKKA